MRRFTLRTGIRWKITLAIAAVGALVTIALSLVVHSAARVSMLGSAREVQLERVQFISRNAEAGRKPPMGAKLNDPVVLKQCVPGCEQLDKVSDSEFQAVAVIKVGPVKARWKGKVRLSDLDPPNSYRISGEGSGGVAGFAKGGALVRLEVEGPDVTVLHYDVDAQIGGKLAQLGQRLINSAAKKTADDFFVKFAAAVAPK